MDYTEHNERIFLEYERTHNLTFNKQQRTFYARRLNRHELAGIYAKTFDGINNMQLVAWIEDDNGVQWQTTFSIEVE